MSSIDERLTNYSSQTNWQLPIRYGALGGYYFDAGQTLGVKDYADVSSGPPVFTGTGITWGSGFVTIDSRAGANSYAQLPFKEPVTTPGGSTGSDFSMCCVIRANSAANNAFADGQHNPIILSVYGGDPNGPYPGVKGLNISITAPGTLSWRDQVVQNNAPNAIYTTCSFPTSPSTFDTFQAVMFTRQTVGGTTTRTIRILTAGLSGTSTTTYPPLANVTQNFRIGANLQNTSGGLFDCAFMQIVNRAIAVSEFYVAGSTPGRVQRRALLKTGVTI